jgi:hypothetical protein
VAQDGFTNNAHALSVSPALAEQYQAAAEALSKNGTQNLSGLLGCDPVATNEPACVQQFIRDFGKRAWRRPLNTEEQARLFGSFASARASLPLESSVQMVIEVLLQSPQSSRWRATSRASPPFSGPLRRALPFTRTSASRTSIISCRTTSPTRRR